jgi:hypothetical protein
MTKKDILKIIEKSEQSFDLEYYEDIERLFYLLAQNFNLEMSVELRQSDMDSWLQTEYYSNKLGKTIIMHYDVGHFEDYEEVAEYIIETEKEIAEFERQLPNLSPVA